MFLIQQITSFLLRAKSRTDVLSLQREIQTDKEEPLMAVIPGVGLSELWRVVSYAESALKAVSAMVVFVGVLSILLALYTTLHERRREMAIVRAIGAKASHIFSLLVLEGLWICVSGVLGGIFILYSSLFLLRPLIEREWGLYFPIGILEIEDIQVLLGIVFLGFIVSLVPALRAYRQTLSDGLMLRL